MVDFKIVTERTICFPMKENAFLLGFKKTGELGHSIYNGFGGKKNPEESMEQAAVRELEEESGLIADTADLDLRAIIYFHFPYKEKWNQMVNVYFLRAWKDEPVETSEMRPEWFDIKKIPYDRMWDSDRTWLPIILSGKRIIATFVWKEDNKTVDSFTIENLPE